MPLAISNILWPAELDEDALALAYKSKADGIEVAPTRVASWDNLTIQVAQAYKKKLSDMGLQIPSLQAILYGQQEAQLLSDVLSYQHFFEHILKVANYAAAFGATKMVFGAPKNRYRGSMPFSEAMSLASERLHPIAERIHNIGVALVIEPVPQSYGCDFIQTASEAAQLVRKINHPGIRLHIDTGQLIMADEDVRAVIAEHNDIIAHVHVSRPNMVAVTEELPVDLELAHALKLAKYSGWLSIEISNAANALTCIEQALLVTRNSYSKVLQNI